MWSRWLLGWLTVSAALLFVTLLLVADCAERSADDDDDDAKPCSSWHAALAPPYVLITFLLAIRIRFL